MRPVLGFQIELDPSVEPLKDASWLRDRLEEWVRGWYERRDAPLPAGALVVDAAALPHGHRLALVEEHPTELDSLTELTWQYPADGDSSALWTSRATIASDSTGVDMTLALSIESIEFIARPFHFQLWVPRLVRDIVRSGRATLGGRTLRSTPQTVSVGAVATFVEQDLSSPTRRLPIVLVARVSGTEGFPVDPSQLASDLCGLAEVWVLNDRWTSYALSDILGARLSCFDGAIRTYWPGFAASDDPFSHPLLTGRRLVELRNEGTAIGRHLIRHLAPVGALRLTDSARAVRVRAHATERRRAETLAAVRNSLANGEVKELEEQLLQAWDRNDSLETDLKEVSKRAKDAEKELETVKENFALVSAAAASSDRFETTADSPADAEISSVADALRRAQRAFPVLRVWSSALTSAESSRFARPDLVHRALEAIAEIGSLHFSQKQSRRAVGNLEGLFRDRGFKYAPSDSQTTLTKYGRDRTFTEAGRRLLFERHLTLGGGDRQNCVQIYFELDTGSDHVDVAYCGMHLPYDGMRS